MIVMSVMLIVKHQMIVVNVILVMKDIIYPIINVYNVMLIARRAQIQLQYAQVVIQDIF